MFIFKDTLKRCNPNAAYTDTNGTRYTRVPRELLDEIPDPVPPEDYSEETYYRTEQDTAPYVVYTRKSDEQIFEVMLRKFLTALEAHYDAVARTKQYDNRLTCALRAGYAGPFQAEGQAFAVWMDECNAYGYTQLAAVKAGTRTTPTVAEFIAELPAAPWSLPSETPASEEPVNADVPVSPDGGT